MTVVRGAEQFRELGRRLKEEGDRGKGLRRELFAAINDATVLLKEELVASALDTLPHRGGIGAVIAASRFTTSKRLAGNKAGVSIKATNPHSIGTIDRGRLRHPLFGNREHWYTQAVKPGWWSNPTRKRGPVARRDIEKAMETVKERIERG